MPHPADDPKTNSLPDPDLNPLLNPLLAANMGRWAEVYFTSPPEKRGEAVAGLIRELRGDSKQPAPQPSENQQSKDQPIKVQPVRDRSESGMNSVETAETEFDGNLESKSFSAAKSPQEDYSAIESGQTCGACGHINSAEQNFCGMCGTSLRNQSRNVIEEEPTQAPETLLPVSESRWQDLAPAPLLDERSAEDASEDPAETFAEEDSHAQGFVSFEPESARDQVGHDQVGREEIAHDGFKDKEEGRHFDDLPQFAREPEPVPYRFRLYVGTVLAVLLALLVYMAWRGTKYISSTSGPQPPAARVIPPAPVSESTEHPPAKSNQAQNASAGNPPTDSSSASNSPANNSPANKAHAENIPSSPTPSRKIAKAPKPKPAVAKKQTVESKPAARVVTKAGNAASITPATSGAEELATAENYLNGSQGKARNPREAAQWLWKSVSKGNAAATMVLSDLYLRGDGVSKSCDQARLLLNAAARKGSTTAAERLRNLQPFGCQ